MKWFSNDPEGDGFRLHGTKADAKDAATKALAYCRGEACNDGWPEDMGICWGRVSEIATIVSRKTKPPAEELDDCGYDGEGQYWSDFDELVEYELRSPHVTGYSVR